MFVSGPLTGSGISLQHNKTYRRALQGQQIYGVGILHNNDLIVKTSEHVMIAGEASEVPLDRLLRRVESLHSQPSNICNMLSNDYEISKLFSAWEVDSFSGKLDFTSSHSLASGHSVQFLKKQQTIFSSTGVHYGLLTKNVVCFTKSNKSECCVSKLLNNTETLGLKTELVAALKLW